MKKKLTVFKCSECEEEFDKKQSLQKHKLSDHMIDGTFKCKLCDLQFNEQWKFDGHAKTCKKSSCDQCDKTFTSNTILNKHIKIVHDKIKLYCYYFNNDQECPFDDKCIFLHEESEDCKFGELCERNFCMFQHGDNDSSSEEGEDESDDNVEDENLENEDTTECDKTFVNPSLVSHTKEIQVTSENIEEQPIQCEQCIFKTPNKARMQLHKVEIHSVKGKYVCSNCKQEFDKKRFKNHKYHGCGSTWSIEDYC